jgi:hypothetical protein
MAKFLEAELPRLVKDVVRAEIPRDQRPSAARSTRSRRRGPETSRRLSATSRTTGRTRARTAQR